MKILASLAIAAGLFALVGPASAAPLAPSAKTMAKVGTVATVVCNKRRHRHGNMSGFYGGFVGDGYGYRRPYYGGFSDGYGSGFFDEGAAPPYAYFPNRRRVYRMWGWQRPYDNGPWY